MADRNALRKSLIYLGVLGAILVLMAILWYVVFRTPEAVVVGRVTLGSEPLIGAQVVFIGEDEDNQTPLVTQTREGGNYRLTANKAGGIPVGKYKVVVTRVALPDGTIPQGEKLVQARNSGQLKNMLPEVYEDRSTTPLVVEVRPGENLLNLELKK